MDEIEYLGATSTLLSYNLFTYCEGNPVNGVDPTGQVMFILLKHFVFMVLVTVLIPTIVALVSSYMPDRKEEDEMDRQDITNKRKQHKTPINQFNTIILPPLI